MSRFWDDIKDMAYGFLTFGVFCVFALVAICAVALAGVLIWRWVQ
jgi:hypothetical protein